MNVVVVVVASSGPQNQEVSAAALFTQKPEGLIQVGSSPIRAYPARVAGVTFSVLPMRLYWYCGVCARDGHAIRNVPKTVRSNLFTTPV
jgi:hypothetical protein